MANNFETNESVEALSGNCRTVSALGITAGRSLATRHGSLAFDSSAMHHKNYMRDSGRRPIQRESPFRSENDEQINSLCKSTLSGPIPGFRSLKASFHIIQAFSKMGMVLH
jgi:hypothetical protein